jgi:hypothetical protein
MPQIDFVHDYSFPASGIKHQKGHSQLSGYKRLPVMGEDTSPDSSYVTIWKPLNVRELLRTKGI